MVLVHLLDEEGQRLAGLGLAVGGFWTARPAGVGGGQHPGDEVLLQVVSGAPAGGEQATDVFAGPVGVANQGQRQRRGQPPGERAVGVVPEVGEQLGPPRWRRPGTGLVQVVSALGPGNVAQL